MDDVGEAAAAAGVLPLEHVDVQSSCAWRIAEEGGEERRNFDVGGGERAVEQVEDGRSVGGRLYAGRKSRRGAAVDESGGQPGVTLTTKTLL